MIHGRNFEFNPEDYLKLVLEALKESIAILTEAAEKHYITLTGQAESLVITDKDYNPLANAISWMDAKHQGN